MNKNLVETIIKVTVGLPLTLVLLPIYALSTIFTGDSIEDVVEFATAWCNPDYHIFNDNEEVGCLAPDKNQ